jgi:hypothetical protein
MILLLNWKTREELAQKIIGVGAASATLPAKSGER